MGFIFNLAIGYQKFKKKRDFQNCYAIVFLLSSEGILMLLFVVYCISLIGGVNALEFKGNLLFFKLIEFEKRESIPLNTKDTDRITLSCSRFTHKPALIEHNATSNTTILIDSFAEDPACAASKLLYEGFECVQTTQGTQQHCLIAREWPDGQILICHKNYAPIIPPQLEHLLNLSDAKLVSIALKYPYAASLVQMRDQSSLTVHRLDTMYSWRTGNKCILAALLQKIVWIFDKNLLGLTRDGQLVTIDARHNYYPLHKQIFKNMTFCDIAVDTKHRWRFIALTDKSLIYGNLRGCYTTDGESSENRKACYHQPRCTYTTLRTFNEQKKRNIWFCDDTIFLYEADDAQAQHYAGTMHMYKFSEQIAMLNCATHNITQYQV